MSITAIKWVLQESESTGTTRCVLTALAEHAHADGTTAWPSVSTLMKEANATRATVYRALKWGVEHDEIERTGTSKSGSGIYTFPGVEGVSSGDGGGLILRPGGSHLRHGGVSSGDPNRKEPSVEPKGPPHARAREAQIEKAQAHTLRGASNGIRDVYLEHLYDRFGLHDADEDADVMNAAAEKIAKQLGPMTWDPADIEEAFAFGVDLSKRRGKGKIVDQIRTLHGFAELFPELKAKASAGAPTCDHCKVRMRWTANDYHCNECGCGVTRERAA